MHLPYVFLAKKLLGKNVHESAYMCARDLLCLNTTQEYSAAPVIAMALERRETLLSFLLWKWSKYRETDHAEHSGHKHATERSLHYCHQADDQQFT